MSGLQDEAILRDYADDPGQHASLRLTIKDVEARIRRWEDTLERELLSLEDAAHRVKDLNAERAALLTKKISMEKTSRVGSTVRAIPTNLMNSYVRAMQEKLREKKLSAKKEFLREVVKEVRVRDKAIQLIQAADGAKNVSSRGKTVPGRRVLVTVQFGGGTVTV
jgi:hypothetical protein